jgi:iron-sulfur cluster assembly protein
MITLTENAIKKVKEFQAESEAPKGGLRISVVGGGCSGLSYKLEFQKGHGPLDTVIEQDGIRVFVDRKSAVYLNGTVVDYSGGLNGTGFTFKNPLATQNCGCGTSFAVV